MIVTVESEGTYIPKWGKNRELPEKDQIKFKWQLISCQEDQKYRGFKAPKMEIVKDEEGKDRVTLVHKELEFKVDNDAILEAMWVSLENLQVLDETRDVTDPVRVESYADFNKYCRGARIKKLYQELLDFCIQKNDLDDGDDEAEPEWKKASSKKNSE